MRGYRLVFLALGSLVVGYLIFPRTGYVEREPLDMEIPGVTLSRVGGGVLALRSLAGEPYLLEVWENDCPYCRREILVLNQIHRLGNLRIVSLIYNPPGSSIERRELLELGIEYPVYLAEDQLLEELGLSVFPTAYLVNPDGKAVERIVYKKDNVLLRRLVDVIQEMRK